MKQYYIVLLLLIVIVLSSILPYKEHFNTSSNKILTANRLNYERLYPNQLISIDNKAWDFVLFRLNTGRGLDIFGNPNRVIIEPMDYLNYAKQYPFQELRQGYFMVVTSPAKKDDFECGFNMASKKVGYFDRTELKFINTLLFGYRQTAKPIQLSLDKLDKLNTIWSEVDLLVLYIIPNSPYLEMIQKQELIMLDMSNVSMDRLRLTNPYLNQEEIPKIDFFNLNNRIVTPGPVLFLISMPMYLITLTTVRETFITRLKTSDEFRDPDFLCIGNPGATSKFQCDSPYTDQGEPKFTQNSWDKPCKRNSDCPYYRANKNY